MAKISQKLATDPKKYSRATYYLKPSTIKTLKILAIQKDVKLTELVRDALEDYVKTSKK